MSNDSGPTQHLSQTRQSLDPDPETMRRLGYQLIDQLVDHTESLGQQRVAMRRSGQEFKQLVDEPLPTQGSKIEDCLSYFFERIVPDMTHVNHPRFHAYIPGPSSFAGAVGEMLAAGTNPFVGTMLGGATLSSLELTVLRWFAELLDCPKLSTGILTSGGSMANLIGLATARARFGRKVLDRGVIYVSREGHASLNKAAKILGFADLCVQEIRVNQHFQIQTEELKQQIVTDRAEGRIPFFVCANAGTTNTGAIDPLNQIANLCAQEDIWFHIDAAYGGFAAIIPAVRSQMSGMERADSLTLDPHKWLYCPMGVGCALVKDVELLEQAFSTEGHYLKDVPGSDVNFFSRGPELSRPARVLSVWMVIRSAGTDLLRHQISEDIRLAELAAKLLSEDDRLEVLEPGLSIVPFRHRLRSEESESERSARDTDLMEATLADGELMLSTTSLDGVNTLRLVVLNHRTTESDIMRSVSKIRQLAT